MGAIMSFAGLGVLLGSLAMIALKNIHRHMSIIFIETSLLAIAFMITPTLTVAWQISVGGFIIMALFPVIDANCRSLFQRKIDGNMLGRIIGLRNFIMGVMQCLILLMGSLLADKVFEPAMQVDGVWADGLLAMIFQTGQGRGVAVMVSLLGVMLLSYVILAELNRSTRLADDILADAEILIEGEDKAEEQASPQPPEQAINKE